MRGFIGPAIMAAIMIFLAGLITFRSNPAIASQERGLAGSEGRQPPRPAAGAIQSPPGAETQSTSDTEIGTHPVIIFSESPDRPPQQSSLWENTAQIAGIVLSVGALIVAIAGFRWGVRQWRWSYFTKEWSTLMRLLKDEARFMDPSKTGDYRTNFRGDDLMKYDVVARLCVGYLDDLYFLGSEKEMRTWFRGSIKLFGTTHRAWLEDHADSYDEKFFRFIIHELNQMNGARTPASTQPEKGAGS